MQTYLVSILLRTITGRVGLLFCLLAFSFHSVLANPPWPDPVERDSLFAQWAKSKSTLPTLFYELGDFNDFSDRVEAESLIRMYGIGGLIIPNGEVNQIKRWINGNKNWRKEPLIHIASINQIFELPFEGLPQFPNQLSVTCYTNDSLVYQLGQAHANVLRPMGIGLIQIKNIPDHFTKHELNKVRMYLQGLNDQRVAFYFGEEANNATMNNVFTLAQNSKLIHVKQLDQDGILDKKSVKRYRKETKDKRVIFGRFSTTSSAVQQIERGTDMMIVSRRSKPQSLINELLLKHIPSKNFYKQQVKSYFGLLAEIEMALRTQQESEHDWTKLKRHFLFQDIALVKNPGEILPIGHLDTQSLVTISSNKAFELMVDRYQKAQHLPSTVIKSGWDSILIDLPKTATVLVDVASFNQVEQPLVLELFDSLSISRSVIAFMEGNMAAIMDRDWGFATIWNPDSSNSRLTIMVEMAFGARPMNGALPGYFQNGGVRKAIATEENKRLIYDSFSRPEVDQIILSRIDSLVKQAIREEMMPGCQIMMVKDGYVIYDKNFGYLTYDSLTSVQWDHIYDIASVTKTVATVPALMHSMDQGKVKLSAHLGDYLSDIDSTKSNLLLDDILIHQAGLKSYLPFWRHAKYFSDSANFLYKKRKWRRRYSYHAINWGDSIQSWIASSPYNSLSNNDGTYRYLYSDLGFMLMKDLVEENCDCSFDQSMDQLLYRPMGMNFTAFNPLTKMPKEQIAPTEQDKYFRSELLQGIVHDKNAALLGGVSGHAGLFSNANDLAKYMQMLLQGGYYGGIRYFSDFVVQVFTTKKNENDRRAMGWDKPYQSVGNASQYASKESFGHSGFTGTLVWADPKYNLVYIFLSNRIYPDPQNYKLIESNTRTKIHDLMYESFLNVEKKPNPGI